MAKQEVQVYTQILLCPIYIAGKLYLSSHDGFLLIYRQTAAIEALSLHGRELEPERKLTVYISDPQRRQERTDAAANERELYIAGLAKSVTEFDLRKLFESVSSLINLPFDANDGIMPHATVRNHQSNSIASGR